MNEFSEIVAETINYMRKGYELFWCPGFYGEFSHKKWLQKGNDKKQMHSTVFRMLLENDVIVRENKNDTGPIHTMILNESINIRDFREENKNQEMCDSLVKALEIYTEDVFNRIGAWDSPYYLCANAAFKNLLRLYVALDVILLNKGDKFYGKN